MKSENIEVRKACENRDWSNVGKWLNINKASFKAFRRYAKIMKTDIPQNNKKTRKWNEYWYIFHQGKNV